MIHCNTSMCVVEWGVMMLDCPVGITTYGFAFKVELKETFQMLFVSLFVKDSITIILLHFLLETHML